MKYKRLQIKLRCARIASLAVAAVLIAIPSFSKTLSVSEAPLLSTTPITVDSRGKKMSLPSKLPSSLLFYEDFESVSGEAPYSLPEGWTSVANPSRPDDVWKAGRLFGESGQVMGTSGEMYAFILPDARQNHDAWMFSPMITLEEDNNYRLSMNVIMLKNHGVMEKLEVALFKSPNANESEKVATLITKCDDYSDWTSLTTYINNQDTGNYYIGFHACSEANSGGMLIDDIILSNVNAPVFVGNDKINMGSKYSVSPSTTNEYEIWNDGYSPLEVSLVSASQKLSVNGLPAIIEPSSKHKVEVTLDCAEIGTYSGEIILSTNDPLSQQIKIAVTQEIVSVPMGNSKLQNFDDGTPDTYVVANGVVNNLLGEGTNKSRALFLRKNMTLAEKKVLYTDFVNMGDNPVLSFDYRFEKQKMMGTVISEMEADEPYMTVYITDDYDHTWVPVYKLGPEEENKFDGSREYKNIKIDLSDYVGKICRVCIEIDSKRLAGGLMNKADMAAYFDNICFGTPYVADIAVSHLFGPTSLKVGDTGEFEVSVVNKASQTAESYTLTVKDNNGTNIATFSGANLASGATEKYTFNWSPEISGSYKLLAVCEMVNDVDNTDNESIPLSIAVSDDNIISHSFPAEGWEKCEYTMVVPVNFYAYSSAQADIYYANDFGINKGLIKSIEYDTKGAEYKSDAFRIYVGETDLDEYADGSTMPDYNDLTLVFEGKIHFPEGEGKMIIPFDMPYQYNGKNLVVYTEHFGKEFVYGRFSRICVSDKMREIAGDVDVVINGRNEIPSNKQQYQKRYACASFNMEEPAYGSIKGYVSDTNGNAIEGATVKLANTSFSAITDESGAFTMPRVATGEYEIVASLLGFFDNSVKVNVTEDSESQTRIIISDIPKQKISGMVIDQVGNPVAGSLINFDGLNAGQTYSKEDGSFSINLIGRDDYKVSVLSDYYTTIRTNLRVEDKPESLTFKVNNLTIHPHAPKAELTDNSTVSISWNQPVAQLHHDNGLFEFELGYDYGYSDIIFGSAYHEAAIVKEVSWYMTDALPHDNFHVYVFGLTNGIPDASKILYHAENVQWRDNVWNTHVLSKPVEADGFMVAIGCSGFMGIGVSPADENYPYIPNTEYYAGDSYRFHISELATSSYANYHLMIRAGVERPNSDKIVSSPANTNYSVYRLKENSNEKILLGTTENLFITDDLIDLEDGFYKWSVETNYDNSVSPSVFTESLYLKNSGIDSVLEEGSMAVMNIVERNLLIENPDVIAQVKIYDMSGRQIYVVENVSDVISLDSLSEGFYVAVATLKNNNGVIVKRFVL